MYRDGESQGLGSVAVGVTHSVTVGSSSWAVVGEMKARVKERERNRRDRIVVGLWCTLVYADH